LTKDKPDTYHQLKMGTSVSIKKLTKKNPTMAAKFAELKEGGK